MRFRTGVAINAELEVCALNAENGDKPSPVFNVNTLRELMYGIIEMLDDGVARESIDDRIQLLERATSYWKGGHTLYKNGDLGKKPAKWFIKEYAEAKVYLEEWYAYKERNGMLTPHDLMADIFSSMGYE